MAFEVVPVVVRRGRRWTPVAAVAIVAVAILGTALITSGAGHSATSLVPTARPSAIAGAVESAAPSPKPAGERRQTPSVLACGTVDRFTCRRAVRAALDLLPADVPDVLEAEVAPGIICGDTLDCPPTHVDGLAEPLASVTLRFADGGPAAWVNVVYRVHSRPLDVQPSVDAWIVRWLS